MFPFIRGWEGLPSYSKALYKDTYFNKDEDYEGWLLRTTLPYQNDLEHGNRIRKYIRNYWFQGSTPISTSRGLPISCFTGKVSDSKKGIFQSYDESNWLGSHGGGLGWDWSDVREINHRVGIDGGKSSGVIPFLGISDRSTLAISQGGARRASQAIYLDMSHPEIEEFIELRKPTGDQNRRAPNLHHGVTISDKFMNALIREQDWDLISPKDKSVVKTVKASYLWEKLMDIKSTLKGEPYLLFIDTVNKMAPQEYINEGISVTTSNLCTEITLRTDDKHSGVCCLGSVNLEFWDEFSADLEVFDLFIADCSDFLDNVLQYFIVNTKDKKGFERARAGAIDERSIGLGEMGYHTLLQSKMIPFESPMAKALNIKIFKAIRQSADKHNSEVNTPCPMSARNGTNRRNIHLMATAPTMSISGLCFATSSGIEPIVANSYTKKVKQGSFSIVNKHLEIFIAKHFNEGGESLPFDWVAQQWASIKKNNGSVQHLDWMDDYAKAVFKTAFEIDQRYVIEQASDRQVYIDQAQSLNIFIPGGANAQMISDLYILGWRKKVKSFYYQRSTAVNRASTATTDRKEIDKGVTMEELTSDTCVSCG